MENAVFLALKRRGDEVYYFNTKNGFEVDFFVPKKKQVIQVAANLDGMSLQRELRAFEDFEIYVEGSGGGGGTLVDDFEYILVTKSSFIGEDLGDVVAKWKSTNKNKKNFKIYSFYEFLQGFLQG